MFPRQFWSTARKRCRFWSNKSKFETGGAGCKYHAYPAQAAFGGYKQSGIGRETHKMMLEHYQQTKCLLVSYSDKPLGLF